MKYKNLLIGLFIALPFVSTIKGMEEAWDRQKTPALQPTIFYSRALPYTLAGYAAAGLALYAYQDKLNPIVAQALVGLSAIGISRGIAVTKRGHTGLSHYFAFYMIDRETKMGQTRARLEKFKNKYEWWSIFAGFCPMLLMEILREKDEAAGLERPFRTQLIGLATSFTLNLLVDHWGTKYKNVPK